MILENKVVIVSGIGPGLGQELAINAGREGAKVVLAARDVALEDVLTLLEAREGTSGIDEKARR